MSCDRCQGLMVCDHPLMFQRAAGSPVDGIDLQDGLTAYRCVVCGNVVDPIIVRNRKLVESRNVRRLRGHTTRHRIPVGAAH